MLTLALVGVWAMAGAQQFSHILSFQGRLCGTDGKPLPDGPYIVTFRMYAAAAGGAALWTENQGVTQVGGVFVAYLGSVTAFPANLFSDGDRWLGITVGGDPEMPDRFRLTPSPWALRAAEADHAANADQATSAQNADRVDNIHAATTPTANYLLALDGSGKFPNSVLRTGSGNGLDADLLDGQHGSFYQNASNLNAGVLPDGRLAGVYSQALTFPNPSNSFTGNGSGLLGLNASNLATGTVPDARLGGNVALLNTVQTFSANKYFTGSVGIGTTSPTSRLTLLDNNATYPALTVTHTLASNDTPAILGVHNANDYWGVGVKGVGGLTGVAGEVDPTGNMYYQGVSGIVQGGSGYNYGLYGVALGGNYAYGLFAAAGDAATGSYAGYFIGNVAINGDLGVGTNTPFSRLDVVSGVAASSTISATHTVAYDDTPAIFGKHDAADYYGIGVKGMGGYQGVLGEVAPVGGQYYFGVAGYVHGGSGTNYGVYGQATGGHITYGVYGQASGASTANYAGYFDGDVVVTGKLTKGSGSFKIDHPLDPENKYLSHSFVESPDMKDVYDGVVTTDWRGYATVTLPDWFEALNRDFRYQLTVLDDGDMRDFVLAKVVRKIEGNAFEIRTSQPNVEVSWQVTGIRQDPYANLHRIPVEEDKPASERRRYLHPDAYGRPLEEGIGYMRQRGPAAH